MPLTIPPVLHSIGGNTSGTLALIRQGTYLLAGGNNVTLSQSGNSVTISAAAGGGGGAFTGGVSNLGNTSGSTGTVSQQIVFVGGNNVTLSQSTGGNSSATITISAANQTLQPIGTHTLGMSNLGNTSGTTGVISGTGLQFILAGGNNITLSQSINGSSATLTISAFNQSLQTEMTGLTAGMSTLGNTSGTTGLVSRQIVFVGGNNITLSQSVNGQSATLTISAFNQSVQPQSQESNTFGMSNLGNTSGTSGVISGPQIQMLIVGGNNVTLSQSLNGSSATLTISAFSQTVQTQMTGLTAGMSTGGNTSGTTGLVSNRLVLVGGNNITLSQSVNGQSATLTISAGAGGAAGSQTFGISNLGNTSGTSGVVSGSALQMILAGGNNITLSQSVNGASATVTISAAAGGGAANQMTLWHNGGAIGSGVGNTAGVNTTGSANSLHMFPLVPRGGVLPGDITCLTWFMDVSVSGSTATLSAAHSSTIDIGIYSSATTAAGTNNGEFLLTLVNSVRSSWTRAAATANSTGYQGRRYLTIHSSQWSSNPVFYASRNYWVGLRIRTSGAIAQTFIFVGAYAQATQVRSGILGQSVSANSTFMGPGLFHGVSNNTASVLPNNIVSSQINKQVANAFFFPFITMNAIPGINESRLP